MQGMDDENGVDPTSPHSDPTSSQRQNAVVFSSTLPLLRCLTNKGGLSKRDESRTNLSSLYEQSYGGMTLSAGVF